MFTLSDGTTVQRDLYSSFLLYNASFDDIGQLILDGIKCLESFAAIEKLHDEEIERIRLSGKKVKDNIGGADCLSLPEKAEAGR